MSTETRAGSAWFWSIVLALFLLRVLFGFMVLPASVAAAISVVSAFVFVGLPIVAVYQASLAPWETKTGLLLTLCGGAVHALGAVLLLKTLPAEGPATVFVQSLVQLAISVWTLGLGALVAVLVKDKNLILPVALFLAGLDVFLVFYPEAPTSKLIRQAPQFFHSMAMSVPSARTETPQRPQGAKVEPQAYVGTADLLFIAAFFVMLSKYRMRVRETAVWLVPVMIAYLAVVLSPLGLQMLPALVPIGLTVLLVNRNEFELTGQEKAMTWAAGLLGLALAGFGLYGHFTYKPRQEIVVPSTEGGGPGTGGSAVKPPPASDGRSQ